MIKPAVAAKIHARSAQDPSRGIKGAGACACAMTGLLEERRAVVTRSIGLVRISDEREFVAERLVVL